MLEFAALADLANHVRDVLLRKGDLDESTPMIETSIHRGGEEIGVEFTVLAPRSVRLSAIWSATENRILFYDAETTRFLTVEAKAPFVETVAA